MNKARSILALAGFLAAAFAAAAFGGLFTARGVRDWYPTLAKPSWTPPSWLFGPVWTALYVAMAVAAWLVWRRAGGWRRARPALGLWIAQLVLNAAWSAIFFGARSPGAGFLEICALWIVLALTTAAFFRRHLAAGWLLVPYLAWVTFAAALNGAIWLLNRSS